MHRFAFWYLRRYSKQQMNNSKNIWSDYNTFL